MYYRQEYIMPTFDMRPLLLVLVEPVLGQCCKHRPGTDPVLAHDGMFTGMWPLKHEP